MYYLVGKTRPSETELNGEGDKKNEADVDDEEGTVNISNANRKHQLQQQQAMPWGDETAGESWNDEEMPSNHATGASATATSNDDDDDDDDDVSRRGSSLNPRVQIFQNWLRRMIVSNYQDDDNTDDDDDDDDDNEQGNKKLGKTTNSLYNRSKTLHLSDIEDEDNHSRRRRRRRPRYLYLHIRRQMQLLVLLLVVSAFTAGFLCGSLVEFSRLSSSGSGGGTTTTPPSTPLPPPGSQSSSSSSDDDDHSNSSNMNNNVTDQTISPISSSDDGNVSPERNSTTTTTTDSGGGGVGENNNSNDELPSYPENIKDNQTMPDGTVTGEEEEVVVEEDTGGSTDDSNETETTITTNSTAPGRVMVGAYYYPWYGDDFHRGDGYLRKQLSPPQLPALGEYNDQDPATISQHLRWSRQANIGLWISSWWGPNSREDQTLRDVILKHPEIQSSSEHKISVFYETTGRIKEDEDFSLQRVGPDLEYLCKTHFNHPNYLRIDDKPVMFMYLTRKLESHNATILPSVIDKMRNATRSAGCGELFIVGDHVFQGPPDLEGGFIPHTILDGVTNYDVYGSMGGKGGYAGRKVVTDHYKQQSEWRALAKADGCAFLPSASPGYNDLGVRPDKMNKPLSRRLSRDDKEGSLFELAIQQARDLVDPAALNLLIINSFNEWHEDTQIEPTILTDDVGTQLPVNLTDNLQYVGYGDLYLNILREQTETSTSTEASATEVVLVEPTTNTSITI